MAAINPKDISGFLSRWSCHEGFTDAVCGHPDGGTNAATAFHPPQGATGNGGWTTMSGANGGTARTFVANGIDGPAPAKGGGLAFQINSQSQSPGALLGASSVPANGGTIIMVVRCPLSYASVNDYASPGTVNSSAKFWFAASTNFTHSIGMYMTYNRTLYGSYDEAATAACTEQIGAAREVIVIRSDSTAGNGVTISLVRNGAIVGSVSAGTAAAAVGSFLSLMDGPGGNGARGRGVVEDIATFNARLSDANTIGAAQHMRADHEATNYNPTTQLDVIGDSITSGYITACCANWVNALQEVWPSVFIMPHGVASADALTWDDTTFFNSFVSASMASGYSITKRVGLIALGTNAILNSVTADTWIASMNNVADRYLARCGSKPFALVPPTCSKMGAAGEVLRRAYRAALLASTHFAGVIDTDSLAPSLVAQTTQGVAATAFQVAICGGSLPFQLASEAQVDASPNPANFANATWNDAAKTLTHATFANTTYAAGSPVNINAGTGWSTGTFKVSGQAGTALTLTNWDGSAISIGSSPTNVGGYTGPPGFGLAVPGTFVYQSRSCGIDGIHLGPDGHITLAMAMQLSALLTRAVGVAAPRLILPIPMY